MASQLGYSDFNATEDNISINKPRRNKTRKSNKPFNNKKVESFLNSMDNEDGSDSLANFTPPPKERFKMPPHPKIAKSAKKIEDDDEFGIGKPDIPPDVHEEVKNNKDPPINFESFSDLKTDKYKSYYNNYIPYYDNPSNTKAGYSNKDQLMKKLNYVIHMMEEQKDEKTKNVTEELVLYLFLGVFIIFTVDSFARASKYTR
tara:strand:+ start:2973 stop:3578 length:606 start_codon:yes stop_codon:yes gene_type:complete